MTETYNKSILPNGVRLVTEKIPTVRSVAFGVWVNVGGRSEDIRTQGLSHFLEHMIFKGTKKRSALDIAREIEAVGGHLNAFTGKELTCFYAQLLDEHIDIAIDVIADILSNSVFAEEEIIKEKTVIIEEINSLEDNPEDLIYDYYIKELFPGHSLGLPILGTKETVNSFTADDLRGLIKNNYTADKVVIAAAGNLEHDEILRKVEKAFNFSKPAEQIALMDIPPLQPGKTIVERSISQSHICIGSRSYPYSDERKFAFFIMNTILGGGMSSRLFQSIREKFGYAYAIYTFNEALIDTGVFGTYIGTDRNRVDDVLELTEKEFKRLREEKIVPGSLARIKNQLKGNLMLGLESTSARMNRLGKMELYINNFISLDDIIVNINKVTAEQVMETAEELLHPDNLLSVIFTPMEQ